MPSSVYRGVYHLRGAGGVIGNVYKGRRTQRGSGIGSIFTKILKEGIKIGKPLLKQAGKAAAGVGKRQVGNALKQGAKQLAKQKGNIAKTIAGAAGASILGAVGEKLASNQKKTTTKRPPKRKLVVEINTATGPPKKKRRKKKSQTGKGLNSIF